MRSWCFFIHREDGDGKKGRHDEIPVEPLGVVGNPETWVMITTINIIHAQLGFIFLPSGITGSVTHRI